MTHNFPSDKAVSATRNDFLDALYGQLDPKLWIELRCIHPVNKQVKTLWMPSQKREVILKQADKLNHQDYSIYFAPCPRTKQKGNAEAAALLPALWVDLDCDNDPQQRATALEELRTFKPKPSMILDSGGGWHAYWLWTEPLPLPDDAARQRAAGLLRGLFLALGADPEYVKSVASIMRLPDSINTKPERGGAIVTLVEFAPERRYSLTDFVWLEAKADLPTPRIKGSTDNHAPLPRVTLDYLTHGAPDHTRNGALFDAACQFRDAGYALAEAEAQLIPRYVADGIGGENPSTREREARATIASAYQRVARDPLPVSGREQVSHLVQRCTKAETVTEQPTPEQIAAAVTACAHLNPVEWAVERQRLKPVCASIGLKTTDLDRLYRQAQRTIHTAQVAQERKLNMEEYLIIDNYMVYRRQTMRGIVDEVITPWIARVVEGISQINDDGEVEHVAQVELQGDGRVIQLAVPSELFGDESALRRFIAASAGETFTVRARMTKHLPSAIIQLSGEYPRRTHHNFMGWTQLEGRWAYVSPGVCVSDNGPLGDKPQVELGTRLRDYGLEQSSWADSLAAFQTAVKVLPRELAPACLAFALLPIVQRWFPAAAPRPALHLAGTTGSGKSEIAALLTSFYGSFTRDTPPAQWGDTINTVETLGYALADAVYWVDDYKTSYVDERTFTRFLQSYSRGMGRGRLTREAKLRQERPCRGLLLSTGEATIEGEASVLARMVVLDVPSWEKRDPQRQALLAFEPFRQHLSGFAAHFAAWIAQQANTQASSLLKELSNGYASSVKGYQEKLSAAIGNRANTGRIIMNWAVLVTVYRLLRRFLEERNSDEVLPSWQDALVETARAVRQERASELFLDVLGQLLANGQVMLASDPRNPEEPRPGCVMVGCHAGQYIYLMPDLAYREVNRVQPLKFTAAAIGAQLRDEGWLVPNEEDQHLAVRVRLRGIRTRMWRLKAQVLAAANEVP
jgi:hypothetical protein